MLARVGLGGRLGDGKQYVSWIHEVDFGRAVEFLIKKESLGGAVNIASSNPLPQAEFARARRDAWGVPIGLQAVRWMVGLGTWAMNADRELVMKSRRVVPQRLTLGGFEFRYVEWPSAAEDLVRRLRE